MTEPTAWDRPGQPPTPAQLRILAEYLVHGDVAEASTCIGVSPHTGRHQLHGLRTRLGVVSSLSAAWRLGWIRIPDRLMPPHGLGELTPPAPPRQDS